MEDVAFSGRGSSLLSFDSASAGWRARSVISLMYSGLKLLSCS